MSEGQQRKIIAEGDWVVIRVNEGAKYVIIQVTGKAVARVLKKKTFPVSALVGYAFGDYLELDKTGHVSLWDRSKAVSAAKLDESAYNSLGDNRNVTRNAPGTQSLSYEEIEKMKQNKDVQGLEMIEKMAASNVGFKDKTIFSQEKYLKKKQQRHLSVFQILRPTARTVAEAYFHKNPGKVFFMRPDTVAQILSLANVTSGDSVMVHETCSGLILGCITERLAGNGNIVSLYTEQDMPVHNAFRCFNFSEKTASVYHPLPFHQLEPLVDLPLEAFDDPESEDFLFKTSKRIEQKKSIRQIMNSHVDSLVIATKFNPPDVLVELFKYLRGSGHLVIYHPHIQPLLDCHEMLRNSQEAISIEIRECWFRDYQVLPLRTHPTMRMHGASGYLLSAIKVAYCENPTQWDSRPKKKAKTK